MAAVDTSMPDQSQALQEQEPSGTKEGNVSVESAASGTSSLDQGTAGAPGSSEFSAAVHAAIKAMVNSPGVLEAMLNERTTGSSSAVQGSLHKRPAMSITKTTETGSSALVKIPRKSANKEGNSDASGSSLESTSILQGDFTRHDASDLFSSLITRNTLPFMQNLSPADAKQLEQNLLMRDRMDVAEGMLRDLIVEVGMFDNLKESVLEERIREVAELCKETRSASQSLLRRLAHKNLLGSIPGADRALNIMETVDVFSGLIGEELSLSHLSQLQRITKYANQIDPNLARRSATGMEETAGAVSGMAWDAKRPWEMA